MTYEIETLINEDFIKLLPFHIAIIDKNYKIVWANERFKEFYGDFTEPKPCYKVCKDASFPCSFCKIPESAKKGLPMTAHESIIDKNGKTVHFIIYFIPLKNKNGEVEHILEISTETKDAYWHKEYNLLFERVPCYITVIDRDFNIIRANEKFRETFGDNRSKTCYEAYKKKKSPCQSCPAAESFSDGYPHTSSQIGLSSTGEKTNYIVTSTPIAYDDKGVSLVMEISTDITEISNLQEQLKNAHDFYATIIQNSSEGIIALDPKGKIQIINQSAKRILNWRDAKKPSINLINDILPKEFFKDGDDNGVIIKPKEIEIANIDGARVPVRFNAIELKDKKRLIGKVAFINDLRPFKELEHEKYVFESESREAIFNALDHGLAILQNILEEEFERLSKRIELGETQNIKESLDLMRFKFSHTKKVKDAFINFSKKYRITKEKCDLNDILKQIYQEFSDAAILQHLDFSIELSKEPVKLSCNIDGVKACLDIMILNSLNALSHIDNDGYLKIKAYNDDHVAILEVQHNACRHGVAPPASVIKENCFGISTAESILKQHHGVIDIISKNNICTFKMKLPK